MIAYKDLKRVNDEAERIDIKGSKYVTVAERVKAFRKLEPNGRIETTFVEKDGVCIATARVYIHSLNSELVLVATGTAREEKDANYINRGSFVEVAESSAVGRALGFLGIGIDKDIASADEVLNAQQNATGKDYITPETLVALRARCANDGVDIAKICEAYKVERPEDLTNNHFASINKYWDKLVVWGRTK